MTTRNDRIVEDEAPRGIDGERKRVLVCLGRYLPGNRDGGPIRSVANMVAQLSPYLDFYIVTRDRDVMDTKGYEGITPNTWQRVGPAKVLYCSSVQPFILRRSFREVRPHVIYLNGCWDLFSRLMLLLRRAGIFADTPVFVAPRGEFSPGALNIKRTKKTLYRLSAKLLGLHEHLLWHASTPREKEALLRAAPARKTLPSSIYVACAMTDAIPSGKPHVEKVSGLVKLAFISRICEMKNLHFLIERLHEVRGHVQLDLFGPVAECDADYWERCKAQLAKLPDNIKVDYQGLLDHIAVSRVLHEHHFFVLPTKGENFCHSAVESFVNATPVILSDQTPWTDLGEVRAGFDIPLNDPSGWVTALQQCVDMDQQTHSTYLNGAADYGRRFSTEEAVRQHLSMFEGALS